jgi:glycosyltransferase involved in cell wall biosynthesis
MRFPLIQRNKMKILFFRNNLNKNDIWSAGVHINEVLNNLSRLEHSIIYANGKRHTITTPSETKATVHVSNKKSRWEKVKELIWALPFQREVLIVFFFMKEIKLFLFAFVTMLRYKPDLIYRRHSVFSSDYLLSRLFKIPCVTEVNGIVSYESETSLRGDTFSQWLISDIEKRSFKRADKYIVVTARLKDTLADEYDIPLNKIAVVENGANTNLFQPADMALAKRELNLKAENSFLCFVGSLAIWHGVKYFISAMPFILKECPNARALIVGDGPLKSELMRLASQLNISDKVTFSGRTDYEKVPRYINASDVCVVPSWQYGRIQKIGLSSLKLCEFLACGKPVVASRISGFEFIEENDCGYLVNPESPQELAKAIITLLGNPVGIKRMGENGREYVLKNRSWEIQSKKVAEICENVVREWRKPEKVK